MKNELGCKIKIAVLFFAAGCAVGAAKSCVGGCKRKLKRCVHKKLESLHGFVDAADRYMDEL